MERRVHIHLHNQRTEMNYLKDLLIVTAFLFAYIWNKIKNPAGVLLIVFGFYACSVEPVETNECGIMELSAPNMANYDPKTGLIEGDILPDKGTFNKAFIAAESRAWEDGIVPYYYRPESRNDGIVILGFDAEEQKYIDEILLQFSQRTAITFIKFNSRSHLLENYPDGVIIEPGFMSNYSYLGRQGGIQRLGIAPFEFDEESLKEKKADILHEAGHTTGLHHEFNRPDRDDFLTILWENIPEHLKRQFNKSKGTAYGTLDMKSIMMYGSYNGSKNDKPVITTTEGETFERNYELSKCDCYAINKHHAD